MYCEYIRRPNHTRGVGGRSAMASPILVEARAEAVPQKTREIEEIIGQLIGAIWCLGWIAYCVTHG